MKKKSKYLTLSFLLMLCLFIIFKMVADSYIEHEIETTLKKELSEDFKVNEFQIQVNSISGNAKIKDLSIKKKNEEFTSIEIKNLELKGISLIQLIFNKNIIIDNFEIEKLKLSLEENSELLKTNSKDDEGSNLNINSIEIHTTSIKNLNINIVSNANHSSVFSIENMSLNLSRLKLNQDKTNNNFPLRFEKFSLKNGELTYLLSDFNQLKIKEITYANKRIEINDLYLYNLYSKEEFSNVIEMEKDHFTLFIPHLQLDDFDAKRSKKQISINSSKLSINKPKLEVFRDKQVKEDTTYTALYSKMLRELPLDLTIDSTMIKKAQISYEEKVSEDKASGKINFNQLDASITNLSNSYKAGAKKTTLRASSIFMEKTPIEATWTFDVNSKKDEFNFKAELGSLDANSFNNFTENHLNVSLKGELEKTYLAIDGNNNSSTTHIKLAYQDFEVKILDDEGDKKNLLTGLINIFISDGSDVNNKKDLKAEAQRNKNKSFFNFLWISIKSALMKLES